MKIKRPVLRYYGGKFRLAPWIIAHFPPHRIYVEPFGGAASILLLKPRSYHEIYNDLWSVIVNVFQVLRNPHAADELERVIRLTPFSRIDFEALELADQASDIERARRTILRSFAGFGSDATSGQRKTGFRASSVRESTTPARDWVNYPSHIKWFTERLAGVAIENRDAEEIIKTHDDTETLFYVDPPYPRETRGRGGGNAVYAKDMTTEDHERLAAVLHACVGMVVLSSYRSELYDRLYAGWHREEKLALADGARPRTEVLFLNGACAKRQRQLTLISEQSEAPETHENSPRPTSQN